MHRPNKITFTRTIPVLELLEKAQHALLAFIPREH